MTTEERATFALLTGTVVDATTVPAPFTPSPPRTPLSVSFDGIGTPPVPTDAVFARAYSDGGFVLAFDAADIAVDDPSSSGPSPKHLTGTFDIHFTLSATGYADAPQTYTCNHDALPIVPPAYLLQPNPVTIRGGVTVGGVAAAGASVAITATAPPLPLPPATTTDAGGTYVFLAVPAAQTITLSATSGAHAASATVALTVLDPSVTVNFEL